MKGIFQPNGWTIKPPLGVLIQRGHPLVQGLVNCWLFNEGAYTPYLADSAFGKNPLIVNYTALNWGAGKNGIALKSAATAGATKATITPALSMSGAFSIECLIYIDSSNDGYAAICTVGGSAGFFLLTTGANTAINFYSAGSHESSYLLQNKWHHIVVIRDSGNQVSFYINGILDMNVWSISGTFAFDSVFNDSASETFIGIMEYLRLWNRALSPSEAQQLYSNPYCFMQPQMGPKFWSVPSGQILQSMWGAQIERPVANPIKVVGYF